MKTALRLAVQKQGRLYEDSNHLLKECGVRFERFGDKLRAVAENFPMEIFFLRDNDIPRYVADGVTDLGIVGENLIVERGLPVEILERLGFAKCRLAIAVPKGGPIDSIEKLQGQNIATSYPNTLRNFLADRGVTADIHEIGGSVEIAPSIGLAEAICDLVSSGSTLLSNGLRELETVLTSEAVLVANRNALESKRELIEALRFRIRAVQRAKNSKYILLNTRNDDIPNIIKLLPGLKSPTIVPLAEPGWSSLHSVIDENDFWERIESLRGAGAEGILVIPIEKMIK